MSGLEDGAKCHGAAATGGGGGGVPRYVLEDLQRLGIEVGRDVLMGLAAYLDRLLEANQRFNLTAVRDRDEAWRRHIIDSLCLLPGLEHEAAGTEVIDIGSGGGLPGVPLAIARPDVSVTLLEATGKKARFLEACVLGLTLASTRVVHNRAETVGRDPVHRQRYKIAVCRAVGPMNRLLEYAMPLLCVGGRLLAMKGLRVEQELDEAGDAMTVLGAGDLRVFDAYPPGFGQNTVVVSILKERPTPRMYPRRPGVPDQSPL